MKQSGTGRRRVLVVLSKRLGNRTYSEQALKAIQQIGNVAAEVVYFDESERSRYEHDIGRLRRWTNFFVSAQVLERKLDSWSAATVAWDCVFLNGLELVPAFRGQRRSLPLVVACDFTPKLVYDLEVQKASTPTQGLNARARAMLTAPLYRRLFARVDIFMPWTRWVGSSLADDYAVATDRILQNWPGYDLELWRPPVDRPRRSAPVILFVGNAFNRKGGPFLLSLFEHYVRPRHPDATLRIVSNHPSLAELRLPPGVELLRGLRFDDQRALVDVFQAADLFVFPTRKDVLGLVLIEAAATGLPIIAADVGAAGEVVIDGHNGYSMPFAASEEEWGAKILELLEDKSKSIRFGDSSRRIAMERFNHTRFAAQFETALTRAMAIRHGKSRQ